MRCAYLIALLLPAALAQYGGGDDTATTTSAAPAASSSGVHDVQVGDGSLVFDPETVTAKVGDKVTFWFHPQNHSVVQSSFDKPCVPLSSGTPIFSDFFPVTSGTGSDVFTITITDDTKPIWLYCGQASHCQSGMVMVINPSSSSGKTLDDYKSAAASVSNTEVPSQVAGGEVSAASESPSSSPSTPSPSSSNAAWAGKATMAPLALAGGLALALL
jgi:plastocyanin